MIHRFTEDVVFEVPQGFTDPFRYVPHPLVRMAADEVIARIEADPVLAEAFSEGKMLGVLVCAEADDSGSSPTSDSALWSSRLPLTSAPVYLAGFSGNIGGRSMIEGFVPPIFDLLDPDGYFKQEEARITQINSHISNIIGSQERHDIVKQLTELQALRDSELSAWTEKSRLAKAERAQRRAATSDPSQLAAITKESQFEKAELRRIKAAWAEKIEAPNGRLQEIEDKISALKKLRADMSDALQEWIFHQYKVHNALGQETSIADIFSAKGLTPPGGTGECAAPKLLEYARRNSLTPLAMGEFWYGRSPDTAVRTYGHFYPSCTSKCGPLLGYMLEGVEIMKETKVSESVPVVIEEDESIIIVEKPSGMPSVPGLDGKLSLQEWLAAKYQQEIHSVHRLDMDTSGVMVYAKDLDSANNLRRQFEEHTVKKTYVARLSAPAKLRVGDEGIIDLPLAPDYDERPRQKVDRNQGKPARTAYKVTAINADGTTDIIFHPITGRTHQLRVHSAHNHGLGLPIVGDRLYGGNQDTRLHLHALGIEFVHPISGSPVQYSGDSQLNFH